MSGEILDAIDGALHDWDTSGDAMRWVPEGERLTPPPPDGPTKSAVPVEPAAHLTQVMTLISFDASAFIAAMRRAGQAASAVVEQMSPLVLHRDPSPSPEWLRYPGDTDDWQSGPCSAWLHDSCRDAAMTYCRCTCHGGPLR